MKYFFVFCPLFWIRLWEGKDSALLKLWVTFITAVVLIVIVGLIIAWVWAWPPIVIVVAAFLFGTWGGSKGWWDKINP